MAKKVVLSTTDGDALRALFLDRAEEQNEMLKTHMPDIKAAFKRATGQDPEPGKFEGFMKEHTADLKLLRRMVKSKKTKKAKKPKGRA